MDDIPYSCIHVIYVVPPCAVGFALHNVHDILLRKSLLVVFNISVACHNFKATVQNYSVTRRMPSIASFPSLIVSVSSRVLVKSSFRAPIFYLGSYIAPSKLSATRKPVTLCRGIYYIIVSTE